MRSFTTRAIAVAPRILAITALVTAVAWISLSPRESMLPPCIIYEGLGYLCPGCGGLRAVHDLLHGAPLSALRNNALLVLGGPVAMAGLLRPASRARGLRDQGGRPGPRPLTVLLVSVGLLALFTVVRNLDALTMLQPT